MDQIENYLKSPEVAAPSQFFPGLVLDYRTLDGDLIEFRSETCILRIHVLDETVLRIRFAPDGLFPDDFSYSDAPLWKGNNSHYMVREEEEAYVVETDKVHLRITKAEMKLSFLNKSALILSEDEKGFHWEQHPQYGGHIVMNSRKVHAGEHYYGLGDKAVDIDLRGKRFENWNRDSFGYMMDSDPLYKTIPFFMGLHHGEAYGIFFDNSFRSFFDFGFERKNVASFWAQGGEMNYYFIYGPALIDVAARYTMLTGTPELPPMWALGFHQSKWSYYPESRIREIASEFRKRRIPCDVIHFDIDYMDGFRCFTWSPEHFPEPKTLLTDLQAQGFKPVAIVDPGIKIDPNYKVWKEAFDKHYFCRRMDGPLLKGEVWPGQCHFPDFTKPEVRAWWATLFPALTEPGVMGVWNDMNEPAVFEMETFPYDVRHDYDGHPASHRKGHNVYGMQMARASYEGMKQARPDARPFVLSRSGYSGIQRYSSVWTGDNTASWEHLVLANIQCVRLSISGISFCGSDIGGFVQHPTGELFARWLQMGLFHPFFRVHSSGDHGDQEPWSFGPEYELIARKFIELRYQLLPYLYSVFYQYIVTGRPMLRPVIFADQDNEDCYHRQDEFCVGDQLLVCPVLAEGVDGRWLYLPRGHWFYFWDDTPHIGGKEVWADAPLDRIPFFVKAGTVMPFAPVSQYIGEKQHGHQTLHAYFASGEVYSSFYEDAGEGYAYQHGEYRHRYFRMWGSNSKLEIQQTSEGSYTPSYQDYELITHGLPFMPKKAVVDGQAVAFEVFNPDKNMIILWLPAQFHTLILE